MLTILIQIINFRHVVCHLIKGQLHKSLTEFFSVNLIVASNIDGVHGMLSLKNFKRFYDDLMDSIRDNGEEYPEKGIRYAFKVVKNDIFSQYGSAKRRRL
ncbi:hypothetical protein CVS40_9223 [Lucilia cuprina]|nr:hypothetical protein CVS40_9223 [Lucilia cuprina]